MWFRDAPITRLVIITLVRLFQMDLVPTLQPGTNTQLPLATNIHLFQLVQLLELLILQLKESVVIATIPMLRLTPLQRRPVAMELKTIVQVRV